MLSFSIIVLLSFSREAYLWLEQLCCLTSPDDADWASLTNCVLESFHHIDFKHCVRFLLHHVQDCLCQLMVINRRGVCIAPGVCPSSFWTVYCSLHVYITALTKFGHCCEPYGSPEGFYISFGFLADWHERLLASPWNRMTLWRLALELRENLWREQNLSMATLEARVFEGNFSSLFMLRRYIRQILDLASSARGQYAYRCRQDMCCYIRLILNHSGVLQSSLVTLVYLKSLINRLHLYESVLVEFSTDISDPPHLPQVSALTVGSIRRRLLAAIEPFASAIRPPPGKLGPIDVLIGELCICLAGGRSCLSTVSTPWHGLSAFQPVVPRLAPIGSEQRSSQSSSALLRPTLLSALASVSLKPDPSASDPKLVPTSRSQYSPISPSPTVAVSGQEEGDYVAHDVVLSAVAATSSPDPFASSLIGFLDNFKEDSS